MKNFKITVVGGGTGTFVVLAGLKNYPVDLTAVITVADSGGSTGRLRSEFGFLPVGDLRQSLAALAGNGDQTLTKLLTYRFDRGLGLKGHNLGNLILTALRDLYGSEPKALEKASSIFKIQGRIIPVSLSKTSLGVIYEDGQKVYGEHEVDEPPFGGGKKIVRAFLKPPVGLYRQSQIALVEPDLLVFGPGDFYTSTLPCLLVSGVSRALRRSKAKICYVANLMNRYSQSHKYKVSDYLSEFEKYTGRAVDYAIINTSKIPQRFYKVYSKEKATPVVNDVASSKKMEVICGDFAQRSIFRRPSGDELKRSFFRHDSDKLARALIKILL